MMFAAVGAGFIPALPPLAVIFYRGGFIFVLRGEGGDEPRPYGVTGGTGLSGFTGGGVPNSMSRTVFMISSGFLQSGLR